MKQYPSSSLMHKHVEIRLKTTFFPMSFMTTQYTTIKANLFSNSSTISQTFY